MTSEKAKEILYLEWQGFLENNIDYAGVSDAYKLAFKALEQMLVIEDIKAEFRQINAVSVYKFFGYDEVIGIIDRHISGKERINDTRNGKNISQTNSKLL